MGSYVLKKAEMDQWQTGYPDETDIREDILRGRGYFVTDGTQPLAYLCVDFKGEPAYGQIRGQWLTGSSPYGVIHRLAIRSESRGKGLSREIFSLAEELCWNCGAQSIRVDTDEKNKIMQHILQKNGFVPCGTIWFAGGDKLAYEKVL